jgi:zinc finger SWIM domain-containing protein 3
MDSAFKDKLFTSFNELQNAIQEYEEKNCVQLYKRTSRNILEKKNQEPYSVNMELKYSYIIFSCIHGGRNFKTVSDGKRPNQR